MTRETCASTKCWEDSSEEQASCERAEARLKARRTESEGLKGMERDCGTCLAGKSVQLEAS